MTGVYIFVGPTLPVERARQQLDATYLPPVSQGDVYRVGRQRAAAIGIVDGYFERVPAVWHKEILWALSQGIPVFGSASMGALRAAELAPFGMEGVGAIFEAFRDGTLEDDDEVAIVHGEADTGYRALSEAMVNVRATLAAAADAGVITTASRAAISQLAKETFYAERSFPPLLKQARNHGVSPAQIEALTGWLDTGRVDQKRDDALAMLRVMKRRIDDGLHRRAAEFRLEPTTHWERAIRLNAHVEDNWRTSGEAVSIDAILDELRLDGSPTYGRVVQQAILRDLLLAEFQRRDHRASDDAVGFTAETFRRGRLLGDHDRFAAWLKENTLTEEGFAELMRDETALQMARRFAEPGAVRAVPDLLRVSGQYSAIIGRARQKQQTLRELGLDEPSFQAAQIGQDDLLRWWAEKTARQPAPSVGAAAAAAGFKDTIRFLRALLREYCYVRTSQ